MTPHLEALVLTGWAILALGCIGLVAVGVNWLIDKWAGFLLILLCLVGIGVIYVMAFAMVTGRLG